MHGTALRMSIVAAGAWVLFACASEPVAAEPTASARFELETGTANGNVFQLRDAVFELTGPTNTTVTSAGIGRWASVDVKPGTYTILLKAGWSLHQTSGMETRFDTSQARLVSPNPRTVVLPAGAVTDVIYSFAIGDTVIGKGEARARIGIEVTEPLCGNGVLDPGEECDPALKYFGATCDSHCSGGTKSCTQATDCKSGICTKGDCGCDLTASFCKNGCRDTRTSCREGCATPGLTCKSQCEANETSCRNTCGDLSEACWGGCWADPIGCALACEPPRALCMDQCTSGRTACDASCTTTWDSCLGTCDEDHATCFLGCEANENACYSGCNRCESCTSAGQCPYE